MTEDARTIFALSSGAPPAAIAIIRVSGPGAAAIVVRLAGALPAPRVATLRPIGLAGDPIDRGLILWFPAEGSVTGEPLAEFHVHGGRAVVARLLGILAAQPGLRMAEPGEFSRRALLNGRMDLVQAEGLADLLLADTETERRAAMQAFDGALGEEIERVRLSLLDLSAQVEALVDHDDNDEVDPASEAGVRREIGDLAARLCDFDAGPARETLREGLSVVIAGPPNAGKSSLLNAIVRREAAIVSEIAGTTRDVIEVPVVIGGHRFRLSDTAGLRETDDVVEAIGVDRTHRAMAAADLILWLDDTSPPHGVTVPVLVLHARADQAGRSDDGGRLAVSAVTGAGLEAISNWLVERGKAWSDGGRFVLSRRQQAGMAAMRYAIEDAAREDDLLIVAEHLRRARDAVDRLTGRAGLADVMDHLFGRFCLGK